ncbi:phosphopantetheine-binding protein [Streptomyces sp. M10(2022)]
MTRPRAARCRWWTKSWRCGELLNRSEIGAEDDFFALGGNSLTGIKIIERVALDYGVQLSVREFYLAQSPSRVAGLIEQSRSGT